MNERWVIILKDVSQLPDIKKVILKKNKDWGDLLINIIKEWNKKLDQV